LAGLQRFLISVLCATVLLDCGVVLGQTIKRPTWNPVIGPPAGAKNVGENVCAACHVQEAQTYLETPMAHAGARAADTQILQKHPQMTFHLGPYVYRITRKGSQSIYSVSGGTNTISAPIIWAFGKPVAGQTYVFQYGGAYYQSRVSFFTDTQALGITIGDPSTVPETLEEAIGDPLNSFNAQKCISCHTTGADIGGVFQPQNSVGGVTCEACHGPGEKHVAAVQQGGPAAKEIFNPARLRPYQLADFCGSCHRTSQDVINQGILGIRNLRFQPYRLELSACWNRTDSRISCLACHNPHKALVRTAALYDSKCLACHLLKGGPKSPNHPGKACPVSDHNCITCHMPRYELPGGHFKFTDHDIRVAHTGQPYPW
jgi:Cytochrome c554 and c-prime